MRSLLRDLGGRKFILAVMVLILTFIVSVFLTNDKIITKWQDMALIVVGFYFGHKTSDRPISVQEDHYRER